MPVLIGWSSVTNSVGWEALVLFGVIFFWTPPHYWPLAMKYEKDYAAADVPMMPVVEGHQQTANLITIYSVVVWALTLAFWVVADMGWIYLGTALILGVLFTGGAVRLQAETDPEQRSKKAMLYFHFSITHLTVLFAALAVDQLVGWGI